MRVLGWEPAGVASLPRPQRNAEPASNWEPQEALLWHGSARRARAPRGRKTRLRCAEAPHVGRKTSPVLPKIGVRLGLTHNRGTDRDPRTMAKMMKLRLGVSDDPTALQPSLSDCLGAMLKQ